MHFLPRFPASLTRQFAPFLLLGSVVSFASGAAVPPGGAHPGEGIYKKLCMECHGERGEGVAGKYDDVLHGDRTVESLAKRIDRTMPEDDPDVLDAHGSALVAEYIHQAFYSPEARARLNPERKSFSRLTVPQYQNSVMDIVTRFRPANDRLNPDRRGLKATYSKVKGMGREKAFERVDPQIAFHFGETTPDPEKLNGEGFAITWRGSLVAPETGLYEFIVKSQNGIRLMLNDHRDAFIDAMIATGTEVREERKSIYLIGGRAYPIQLEFLSYKQKTASVELRWKPPHGVEGLVPAKVLNQDMGSERMVVSTSFPADDRSDGYERGTTISKEWDRATTSAALEVVSYVEKNLEWITRSKSGEEDRPEKLKKFAAEFVESAFRRPLAEEERRFFVDAHFEAAATPELATKRVVLLALKSPRFLYPDLKIGSKEAPDGFDVAARLALALWDSIPDGGLLKMAAEGKLNDPRQVAFQSQRMLDDPRAKNKLHGFFHHWLEMERADLATKDAKLFPGFDAAMLAALRESLVTFIDDVVWGDRSDFRELIGADYLWMNQEIARYYGKELAGAEAEYQRVAFDPKERAGIITHPYLLASFAYNKTTSPIHRGVFLTRNVMGMALKSPPVAVAFEDSKFDPTLTMREKVVELTKNTSCMGCHSVINPLGFALENYDAVGRWRTKDNNKPVDSSGEIDTEEGRTVKLKGPRDIAAYAASSPAAHRAFIRQLFHHFIKQPAGSYGDDTLDLLRKRFQADQFNIRKLISHSVFAHASEGLPAARQILAELPPPPAPQAPPSPPPAPVNQTVGAPPPSPPAATPAKSVSNPPVPSPDKKEKEADSPTPQPPMPPVAAAPVPQSPAGVPAPAPKL